MLNINLVKRNNDKRKHTPSHKEMAMNAMKMNAMKMPIQSMYAKKWL